MSLAGKDLYSTQFYRELETARDSATQVLPIVTDLVKPASIVDIGCGAGHWLGAAIELGITDILGVDGDWALNSGLAIPGERFRPHDLLEPLVFDRKFDLAISLEVAEHLPERCARGFVATLCRAADCVLFSAAIPGQGGRHHVNEQWPAYWAALFAESGFACYDILRPRIWDDPKVLWYYAQNSLLFASTVKAPASLGQPVTPLPLVHPGLWSAQVNRWRSPGKLLERLANVIGERSGLRRWTGRKL